MVKWLGVLLALAVAAGAVGPVAAADIYVSIGTGSNDNPGTREAPKKFLWRAMADMKDGDKVFVAEGTYPGQSKSGVMPKITVSNVTLEGGWKADFSDRNPFKYFTIIEPPADVQGAGREIFQCEGPTGITIDGFCLDRGPHSYYFSDGEPGARKRIEGHVDNSAWGYRNMNKGKSGSDPTIELLGRGSFTVRNCVLVNNPWWGIYVKAGGTGETRIENNLILISQGRAIEALPGGGWDKPVFVIRNNTVLFGHTIKTTEGDALKIDPRKDGSPFTIEKNVFAFCDGGGVDWKFGCDNVTLTKNKFFFCRRGDASRAGAAVANAGEFSDELTCKASDNVHELPALTAKLAKAWVDRWSSREDPDMLAGNKVKAEDLEAIRAVFGLKEYAIPGYEPKTFANYKSLPSSRNNYNMSRYPFPMKKGERMNWAQWVMPLIGAEGELGIQPFEGKEVLVEARPTSEAESTGGPTTVKMDVQFSSELLKKLEEKAGAEGTNVKALIEKAVAEYLSK